MDERSTSLLLLLVYNYHTMLIFHKMKKMKQKQSCLKPLPWDPQVLLRVRQIFTTDLNHYDIKIEGSITRPLSTTFCHITGAKGNRLDFSNLLMRINVLSDFLECSMIWKPIDTNNIFEKFIIVYLDLKTIEKSKRWILTHNIFWIYR